MSPHSFSAFEPDDTHSSMDWESLLQQAEELASVQDIAAADQVLLSATEPPVKPQHLQRAARLLMENHPDKALEYLNVILSVSTDRQEVAEACWLKAFVCQNLNLGLEAESAIQQALALEPEYQESLLPVQEWIASWKETTSQQDAAANFALPALPSLPPLPENGLEIRSALPELPPLSALPVPVNFDQGDEASRPGEVAEVYEISSLDQAVPEYKSWRSVLREKRQSGVTASALLVAILSHAAILFLLGVLVVALPNMDVPEIIANTTVGEEMVVAPEQKKMAQPTPNPSTTSAAAMANQVNILSSHSAASIAVPEFDGMSPNTNIAQVNFGTGNVSLGTSFSGDFNSGSGSPVNFFGIKSNGKRVVFVIEAERYMLTDPKGGIPAYEIVKEDIAGMIAKMDLETVFNVVVYDHGRAAALSPNMMRASSTNVQKAREWLDPINKIYEKIGLPGGESYANAALVTDAGKLGDKVVQGYVKGLQIALQMEPDAIFMITSGWRWMHRWETEEERNEYYKKVKWTEKDEQAWQAAVKEAEAWIQKENAAREAKGVSKRVIRDIHEVIGELKIQVRYKPGPNLEAEDREDHLKELVKSFYIAKGKKKPQINIVLFVGKDEKSIPMEDHFKDLARRVGGGKFRVLEGLAALKNVTGRS